MGSYKLGEDLRGSRNNSDVWFECVATAGSAKDGRAYHLPGAPEFIAYLLDVDAGGAEHLGENAPRPGSRVLVSFGTEGLVVREESEADGMRSYTAAWFAAITPVTFVTAVVAGQQDPLSLQIAGLHPVWSLSFRMATEDAVDALTHQVNSLSLSLISWMHNNHSLETGSRPRSACNDGILCGTYALHLELINRSYAKLQPLQEPVARRVWFQIAGPTDEGNLIFSCWDTHRSDGECSFSLIQSLAALDAWQVAQHVLFFIQGPSLKGVRHLWEVPPMLFLAFDSTDMAMAVSDLVAATKLRDRHLKKDAQQRLTALAQAPAPIAQEATARHCWRISMADIEERRRKEREAKKRIADTVAEQKAIQAHENKLVMKAVEKQLEENLRPVGVRNEDTDSVCFINTQGSSR